MDRVAEVPVEPWAEAEFREVAGKGATELNILIHDDVVSKCIEASFASIGVFQEVISETCKLAGVHGPSSESKELNDANLVDQAVAEKAVQYAARHQRALESIAAGNISTSSNEGLKPLFSSVLLDQGSSGGRV